MAYGTAVEPGRRPRGSIVDVTPTVLYFLGLPVARDMDGFARADLFSRGIHRGSADCVHSELQSVVSCCQFPVSSSQFPVCRFPAAFTLATGT